MALSAVAVVAHTAAVVTRGLAVHRAPWGNMYEFVTALTCVAAIFFLFVMIRYRAWTLGVFVMGAVVVALGLAETLIYTAAGQLVPALQSYWLDIHVTAMTLATGIFFVAAVLGVVYLAADRYNRRVAAGRAEPGNGIMRRLPSIEQIDRLTYRTDRVRVPGLDLRRHRGRDLGRSGLGPLLGLGSRGDLGLHHLGALRRVPARPGHRRLARPAGPLHPAARLRQPHVQHPGRAGLHRRPALLRGGQLTGGLRRIAWPSARRNAGSSSGPLGAPGRPVSIPASRRVARSGVVRVRPGTAPGRILVIGHARRGTGVDNPG